MAAPIYNPIVPCVQPLVGGFYPGAMIRIQGTVPPTAERFAFNLQCGPNTDPRDDIALHLNFRFIEMCIVRNNLTSMNWGPEEIGGGMPLQRGQGFEALLLCEPNCFKVALNGQHFCEFPHRLPYQRVTHLTVDGDVIIQMIGFESTGAPPPQAAYMQQQVPPAYGAPPPAYGAPGYGGPQGMPVEPGMYAPQSYAAPQQRQGLGTGAAVGLGVGAIAAGGLAGYALGGGFSSDSPPHEEMHGYPHPQQPVYAPQPVVYAPPPPVMYAPAPQYGHPQYGHPQYAQQYPGYGPPPPGSQRGRNDQRQESGFCGKLCMVCASCAGLLACLHCLGGAKAAQDLAGEGFGGGTPGANAGGVAPPSGMEQHNQDDQDIHDDDDINVHDDDQDDDHH